jgi:hypothetical protein
VTLVRAGGHFPGGTVLHWADGFEGRGALLTSDIVMVVPDRRHVAFLYSYPNLIPLPPREVERIGAALAPLAFDAIVGGWWGRTIAADGQAVVRRSVQRYVRAVAGGSTGRACRGRTRRDGGAPPPAVGLPPRSQPPRW